MKSKARRVREILAFLAYFAWPFVPMSLSDSYYEATRRPRGKKARRP